MAEPTDPAQEGVRMGMQDLLAVIGEQHLVIQRQADIIGRQSAVIAKLTDDIAKAEPADQQPEGA